LNAKHAVTTVPLVRIAIQEHTKGHWEVIV
jgi:hypothetical protein